MTKTKRLVCLVIVLLVLAPLVYLYHLALEAPLFGVWTADRSTVLTDFTMERNGETTSLTLPTILYDGKPNEKVILTTQVSDAASGKIYLKSVYAPLKVYANDALIYEFGAAGTYPSYLPSPTMKVRILDLPDADPINLRLEYDYPTIRGDLILDAPLTGAHASIFVTLLFQQENLFSLYTFFILLGILLLCIGLFAGLFEREGLPLIWLGLMTLCCGLWGLGEYDITGIFIQNEVVLYLMAFSGSYFLPVPIHFFFRSTVGYHDLRPMTCCALSCTVTATIAMLLQCMGAISLFNVLPFFLATSILSFFFGAGYTVYEWRRYDNQTAKRFLVLWGIVITSILMELVRFLRGTVNAYGFFVQVGLLVFLLANCLIGGIVIRKAMALRAENRRMEQEYKLMEVQVAEQQRYHHLLMDTRQTLRQQRHDLRHQVAAIRTLAEEGKWEKLTAHLDSLDADIPEALLTYCENIAVNAVVAHYIASAKAVGVTVTADLVVPEPAQHINDNNLCVIFGNILENAVEACSRMQDGGKFLTIHSHLHNGMLIITQENSFEGHIHCQEDKFYSAKREGFGIGLTSVQSVARKHEGNATFTADGRVFHSAIYVKI